MAEAEDSYFAELDREAELQYKIWRLMNLVHAATNNLSSCFAINNLIVAGFYHNDIALAKEYSKTFTIARSSFVEYTKRIKAQRAHMPLSLFLGEYEEDECQAYDHLSLAAYLMEPIMALLDVIEAPYREAMDRQMGWTRCPELDEVEEKLCLLIAQRGREIEPNPIDRGWMVRWKDWNEKVMPPKRW